MEIYAASIALRYYLLYSITDPGFGLLITNGSPPSPDRNGYPAASVRESEGWRDGAHRGEEYEWRAGLSSSINYNI